MLYSIVLKSAGRLVLSVVLGLTLLGSVPIPAAVKADTNPVDLELGGKGATPWSIGNIEPGEAGTETVELRNVGSRDGFVTIWISDITNSEGTNPETETGDTTEPGEFGNHLLLGLSADGLITNLSLPTTINNFPHSASGPDYIEVIPVKSGDTVNLKWEWELPAQTGNEVQGDTLSFTFNYLLRECTVTDLSSVVAKGGMFTKDVTIESEDGRARLAIGEGATGRTEDGEALSEVWVTELDIELPPPPENTTVVGLSYNIGPDGATFDRPITITLSYDPGDIPRGVDEVDLAIALWDKDAGEWVTLDGCIVDTVNNTISAPISHFSRYTVIAPLSYFRGAIAPVVSTGEGATTTAVLETNMLGKTGRIEIGTDGTLSRRLTLTDRSGNFIIDIDGGTKIIGSKDVGLSLIELRTIDQSIVVPDDIVVLSPVYELTGYTRSMGVTRINFRPPARFTIRYDPRNLPESSLAPFIANYTDEQGLIRLQPPPDSTVEVGKVGALIDHASLFVVVAEVPQPPLPAELEVTNLTINPLQAQLGQPVTISLAIANEGGTEGSFELHLVIDGITRAIKKITLDRKSSQTLTFEVSNLAEGDHRVTVAGLTKQFRVVGTATAPAETRVNWPLLGTSIGVVLVMGALGLYLFTRRSHRVRLR